MHGSAKAKRLANTATRGLVFLLLLVLGITPVMMQHQMANASPEVEMSASEMPLKAPPSAKSGGFCVHMAPCIAIIEPISELRTIGIIVARLAPTPTPLADGRALPPPFHPPIA